MTDCRLRLISTRPTFTIKVENIFIVCKLCSLLPLIFDNMQRQLIVLLYFDKCAIDR